MTDRTYDKGLAGESRAVQYLENRGMRLVHRRYRAAGGEIDLVMRDGDTLVFVEVKLRNTGTSGEGLMAVTAQEAAQDCENRAVLSGGARSRRAGAVRRRRGNGGRRAARRRRVSGQRVLDRRWADCPALVVPENHTVSGRFRFAVPSRLKAAIRLANEKPDVCPAIFPYGS